MLWSEWKFVETQIEELNDDLERISAADAGCTRIRQIPGIGPAVATAIVAAIDNGAAFRRAESSPHGLASCHVSIRPVVRRSCSAANRLARIAWAVLSSDNEYRPVAA
jgi:transposase